MAYAKINSITNANMAKVSSIAKAAIGKIGSIDAPSAGFADSYSVNFDGTNDHITADGTASEISGDLGSFSIWVKLETYAYSEAIFSARDGTSLGYDNFVWCYYHGGTNQLRLEHKGGGTEDTLVTTTVIENNGWHHIACTWNTGENQTAMYVDGSLEDTGTAAAWDAEAVIGGIDFGKRRDTSWLQFEGNMNDIALFDDVLTSGEVSTIYNAGEPTDISSHGGLVAYWMMENNTDDSSSNSNSITLVNGAAYEADTP
jgi:hypothetical protein